MNGRWRGLYDFDPGARLLDWGAHTVDLCQWANAADGTIDVSDEALRADLPVGTNASPGLDAGLHARNFFDAVKSRQPAACNADMMRNSHVACHAAAIAWMLGRKLSFDPSTESFVTASGPDHEANGPRGRPERDPWGLTAGSQTHPRPALSGGLGPQRLVELPDRRSDPPGLQLRTAEPVQRVRHVAGLGAMQVTASLQRLEEIPFRSLGLAVRRRLTQSRPSPR